MRLVYQWGEELSGRTAHRQMSAHFTAENTRGRSLLSFYDTYNTYKRRQQQENTTTTTAAVTRSVRLQKAGPRVVLGDDFLIQGRQEM